MQHATITADCLIKAGAKAVKIEGIDGHEHVIQHLVESGIPVMGHLGLTPQFVHFTGYKVQGKSESAAIIIKKQAQKLQQLGCFAIVLECVPVALGATIQAQTSIPVIGIGAGKHVDGQVLVLHDMLGITGDLNPKFVRHFLDGSTLIQSAIDEYCAQVQAGNYPTENESYH